MFGEKDWQKLQVVRRMVADLDWPVEVAAVPTMRDPDGLALSSRNRYLTPEQPAVAPGLYQVLLDTARTDAGPAALADGNARLRGMWMQPDYLVLVEADTMRPIASASDPARLIAAARPGTVRLLDNVAVPP